MNPPTKVTPAMLLILDGFGHSEEISGNAIRLAHTPNIDELVAKCPHMLINASESHVGLPSGQMGNSEVGHLNIGAGRVVRQDFERINHEIETQDFFANPVLLDAVQKARDTGRAIHVFGLLSDGGIHSHESHLHALAKMSALGGVERTYVHAFLDGRDTPPRSAELYIKRLEEKCTELQTVRIASIIGRYYAMDRDRRWDRVKTAYLMIAEGQGQYAAATALDGLQDAYERDESDEFVKATTVGSPVRVEDGDVIIFMNFRSDRARELTSAFNDPKFDGFNRTRLPQLGGYYTLTTYNENDTSARVAYTPEPLTNGLGQYIAAQGLKQLRIAETEKYPHVTFFFNGGEERVFQGEDRIIIPSPAVATYDLQPEMSAFEVTDQLEAAILSRSYNMIVCNYANADMVGHTGNLAAAIKAIEAIDTCVGRVTKAMQSIGGEVIITADHGNAEAMEDHINHQPHTQHTTNQVPFIYVGRRAQLAPYGSLSDLAPTILSIMGLAQPEEMTGRSLVSINTQ